MLDACGKPHEQDERKQSGQIMDQQTQALSDFFIPIDHPRGGHTESRREEEQERDGGHVVCVFGKHQPKDQHEQRDQGIPEACTAQPVFYRVVRIHCNISKEVMPLLYHAFVFFLQKSKIVYNLI